MPTPATSDDDRGQDERDDRQPGDELAVDDVVAVDGLRHQPRQRPLGPLRADGVEAERDAQQRPEEADPRTTAAAGMMSRCGFDR